MALIPGTRLGVYNITAQIGEGGMGQVYRATDTRLKRQVAIKILPPAVAADADRLARFQREAEVLASLNHPNIAGIYGLEEGGGMTALVMELVEGDDLSLRIARAPIPIDEAMPIARQIADALEAAHEQGIIHRDLKPANIKVKADGTVKVLDFGLAKALTPDASSAAARADLAMSPTITSPAMTQAGMILGTAAYMSPEQSKGRAVDKRTDIWAFGAVLFEMLTGQRAFHGEDVSDTLAHILMKDPDWAAIPATIPSAVVTVLRRCLQKDRKRRARDIGDVSMALDGAFETAAPQTPASAAPAADGRPAWMVFALTAAVVVALAAAGALATIHFTEKPPALLSTLRFQIRLPDKVSFTQSSNLVFSPDDRTLAFAAVGTDGEAHLWVQGLDGAPARALTNTDVGLSVPPFFWSPDSRFLVYSGFSKIRKVEVSNGMVQDLCDKPGPMIGGSWNQDGVIIFGNNSKGLWRTKESGSAAVPLTVLDASRHEREHELPQFLPDGRHFLYLRVSDNADQTGVYVGFLDDPPDHQNMQRLLATAVGAVYLPSRDGKAGQVLQFRSGTVTARSFDPDKLQLRGEPVTVAEGVGSAYETPWFGVSSNVLVYRQAAPNARYQLTAFDEHDKRVGTVGDSFENLSNPALSPDGTRVAFGRTSGTSNIRDLWLMDVARGAGLRLTFGTSDNAFPLWSPDGRDIIFSSNRDGGVYALYRKSVDASQPEQLVVKSDRNLVATSWSQDGQLLVYQRLEPSGTAHRLWALPLRGAAQPVALPTSGFDEISGRLSPDGRWLAYASLETGRFEVYVREFTGATETGGAGGKWIVSRSGGYWPMWRKDGKELLYIADDQATVMSVTVDPGRSFQAGPPRVVFHLPLERYRDSGIAGWANVAFAGDLKRLLTPVPVEQPLPQEFEAVVNWPHASP